MDNQTQSLDAAYDPKDQGVASNPEEQAIQSDRVRLVRQMISQLPEKQRSCMQLRDMEGKSYKDIATILDITEEQVKVNIFRARQTIREKFKRFL
jgi:RNA polymerase sigma-70 factor (ECF subfamily)